MKRIVVFFLVSQLCFWGNCLSVCVASDIYTLQLGDLSFSVSAMGGRVVSFKRDGREVLTDSTVHPVYFGSTLWLSPQSENWPPHPNVDKLPYVVCAGTDKLVLSSQTEGSDIRIDKTFSVSMVDTAILVDYVITNLSSDTLSLAPWDVTRVRGGLGFFPLGDRDDVVDRGDISSAYQTDNVMWCPFVQKSNMNAQKLFRTAQGGWLAHYRDGLLFVKCFPDIKPEDTPPGQGEVEIFIAANGAYVELENHGCYSRIAPYGAIKYRQKWFLISVSEHLTNDNLLEVVHSLDKTF